MVSIAPNNAPLAPNEQISRLRFILIVMPIVAGIAFFILANAILRNRYVSPFQSFFAAQAWCGILAVLLSGVVVFRIFLLLRCFQRIEQRRIALAQDDFRWLADASERALPAILPETLSIQTRVKRGYILVVAIFMLGYSTFVPLGMDIFPLSFLFTLPIDVFIIIGAVSFWTARSVLEITPEACILRLEGRGSRGAPRQSIAWSDVRLLAFYALSPILGRDVVQYELSSQREMIYWRQLSDGSAAFSTWEPVSSREVYQQQMDLLIALVREKTGLPCIDLDQRRELQEK